VGKCTGLTARSDNHITIIIHRHQIHIRAALDDHLSERNRARQTNQKNPYHSSLYPFHYQTSNLNM
jgi:hypothetical protein